MNHSLRMTLTISTIIIISLHSAADDCMPDLVYDCVRFNPGNHEQSLLVHATPSSLKAVFVPSSLKRIVIDSTIDGTRVKEQILQEPNSYLVLDGADGNQLLHKSIYGTTKMPASAYGSTSRYLILFADQEATWQGRLTVDSVKNDTPESTDFDALFDDLVNSQCEGKAFALFDIHAYLVSLNPGWRNDWPTMSTEDSCYISKLEFEQRKRYEKKKIIALGFCFAALSAGGAIAYMGDKCSIQ